MSANPALALAGLGGNPIETARQARLARASRIFTQPVQQPPPLKGWNSRDPFAAMDAQDAITLDNWYPDFAGCLTRDGCRVFTSTDSVSPVPTLMVWRKGALSAMVAASAGQLWGIAGMPGNVNAIIGAGPYGSDWWAWANFNGRLFLCNGYDGVLSWQGPAGGPVGDSGFTLDSAAGFDPSYIEAMNGVAIRHNRLFFWTGRDAGFWYGPLLGVTGTLSYFPFDTVVPDGAALVACDVLTYDGGTGIADYSIFILSTGEMLVYSGTDPSNPDNWALVGLYVIAAPIATAEIGNGGGAVYPNRSVLRYGGDVYVITSSDHAKLSQLIAALKAGAMPPRSKVSGAVIAAAGLGGALPGWQVIYWGYRRRLIFNVPNPDGSYDQHVYNPALDAWCRYRSLPAMCWCVFGDRLFFGTPQGMVVEYGIGASDQVYWYRVPWDTTPWDQKKWSQQTENPIQTFAQQAWTLFDTPLEKRVAAVRPMVQAAGGGATYNFQLGFDYADPSVTITVNEAGSRTPWDVSPWGSPWTAGMALDPRWNVAGGDGSAISFAIATAGAVQLTWVRTDLRLEPGTAL